MHLVQALDWLGPDAAGDAQVVAMLRRSLPDDVKHDLKQNISDVPGWAAPLVRSIVADQKPPRERSLRSIPRPR